MQNEIDNYFSRRSTQEDLNGIFNSKVVKQKPNQNEEWRNITTTTKKTENITVKQKSIEETTQTKQRRRRENQRRVQEKEKLQNTERLYKENAKW